MTASSIAEPLPLPSATGIRAVIVDDEPAARRRLRAQLADYPDVQIVAELGDAEALTTFLGTDRPALIFMDIQMPGQSGIDVARSFPDSPRPILVYVTAYEEHAVEAFAVQAADYLLKPVSKERLAQCLARVRLLCAAEQAIAARTDDKAGESAVSTTTDSEAAKVPPLQRIVVPARERMIVINSQQIDWIESAGNYAIIHVGRDTHVLRETLTELEQRLAAVRFMRISRSTLVNMDRVRELRNNGGGAHEMVLADGTKLPITRGIREIQSKLETG